MIRYFLHRLKPLAAPLASETDAVLSFEWVLLLTLLTIGIVSGVAAARDAIIDELGDVAEAAQAFDQSYSLVGTTVVHNTVTVATTPVSVYTETAADQLVIDCGRGGMGTPSQGPQTDGPE